MEDISWIDDIINNHQKSKYIYILLINIIKNIFDI
jgi:hypothetical protein